MNEPKLERCSICGAELEIRRPRYWSPPFTDLDRGYYALLRRFRHLLKSEFIGSFDEWDPELGRYRRNIAEADVIARGRSTPAQDNNALTAEELRETADCGIPVWLVGVGAKNQWVRINYVESLTIGFSAFGDAETWSFCAERYGKTVLAYLRSPEKGE